MVVLTSLLFRLMLLITAVMLFGLLYSTNRSYGIYKITFYFIYNFTMFMVASLYYKDFRGIEKLLSFAFLLGLLLAVISFVIKTDTIYAFARFRPSDSVNPIFLARSLGVSILCSFFFLSKFKRSLPKILLLLSYGLLLSPIIWSGSRAPFLGLFFAAIIFYLLQPSQTTRRKMWVSFICIICVVLFMLYSASQVTARITTPIAQEASAAFRVLAWFQGLQDFLGSPLLGIGTGSFFLDTPWIPLIYPHNLILEMACENGLLGLAAILSFIGLTAILGLRNIRFYHQNNQEIPLQLSITVFSIFAYTLWNSMFSGDISTNPVIWFAAGLINVLYQSKNSQSIQGS